MSLSRKRVGFIITLIIVSLSGLIILQSYMLRYAFESKEQAFQRNVLAALNAAVSKLELNEVTRGIFQTHDSLNILSDSLMQGIQMDVITLSDNSLGCGDTVWKGIAIEVPRPVRIEGDKLIYTVRTPQHVMLQAYSPESERSIILVDSFMAPGEYVISIKHADSSSGRILYRYQADSMTMVFDYGEEMEGVILGESKQLGRKIAFVTAVYDRLTDEEWLPIEKRLDRTLLDSVLNQSLREAGIELQPAYGVISDVGDSLSIIQPANYEKEIRASELRAGLFPNDYLAKNASLAVYFPERQAYVWRQMGPLLIAIVAFMLIIIMCFMYTIYTIISQKRFAGLLVNFINNMTHEFKTPISTVTLASEAIDRPEVLADSGRVARYNRMIQNENRRMRNQVEKILQMAVLEEGDYDLKLEELDLHTIIRRAVGNLALQVENRQGEITCDLQAEQPIIRADPLHLENIIHNLLDNANKYSREKPLIEVNTRNHNGRVIVAIRDHGIGISEKDRKQVFEKYFRVDSGNVHDVKGFGLGLSYVKLMVEAQGGTINLSSEKSVGTTVELSFAQVSDKGGLE